MDVHHPKYLILGLTPYGLHGENNFISPYSSWFKPPTSDSQIDEQLRSAGPCNIWPMHRSWCGSYFFGDLASGVIKSGRNSPVSSMSFPLPSGKLTYNYRKSPFFMGKSTINGQFSIAFCMFIRPGNFQLTSMSFCRGGWFDLQRHRGVQSNAGTISIFFHQQTRHFFGQRTVFFLHFLVVHQATHMGISPTFTKPPLRFEGQHEKNQVAESPRF